MIVWVLRGVVPALVAGSVLVSCTSTQEGSPEPENTSAGSTESPGTTKSSAAPRPREIRVDGVDPCKLLTAEQMAQLGVNAGERNDSDIVKTGNAPTCEFSGDDLGTNYGVALVADRGIDYWTGAGNTDVSAIKVSGFEAKRISLSGVEANCAVAVDVADGQQLYVDFIPIGSDKPSKDEMCQNVEKGAGFALATLQTLK